MNPSLGLPSSSSSSNKDASSLAPLAAIFNYKAPPHLYKPRPLNSPAYLFNFLKLSLKFFWDQK